VRSGFALANKLQRRQRALGLGSVRGRRHNQAMSYSRTSEPVRFERTCKAVLVPAGDEVELPAGSIGYITQALGGSFTVYVEGNLFRIANHDADAIGKEPMQPPELPENASEDDLEKLVWSQLKTCFDPEIPVNIVDLGLVYSVQINTLADATRRVDVKLTLTAPGCGMGDHLVADVQRVIEQIPTVSDTDIELTFDPPWNRDMMSDVAKLETGML
jgi:probable FeS assembly SUF system protein SufT